MHVDLILLLGLGIFPLRSNQRSSPQLSTSHIGYIEPKMPYVFIGANLSLDCILADGNGSESLYFRVGDNNVSSHYQRIVSPSILQLQLPITDTSLQGLTVYCLDSARAYTVDEQNIQLEYAPRNVTDFQIIVDDWRSLAVTWSQPEYVKSTDVETKVSWSAEGASYIYECTGHTESSCRISGDDYRDSSMYYIIIRVRNTRTNDTHTQELDINPGRYVRVSGVELCRDSHETEQSVYLCWSHKFSLTRPVVYRLTVRGAFNLSRSYNTSKLCMNVTGLHPGVEYQVGVAAGTKDSIYWSRENTTRLSTLQTNPGRGAVVTPGLYSVTEDLCDNQGSRNVRVYLRPPDESCWNGQLTNYTLVYVPSGARSNMSYTAEIDSVFHQVLLSCSLQYDVYISVYNNKGGSPSSHLHIPRQDKVAGPMFVRVSDRGSFCQVEWRQQVGEEGDEGLVRSWLVVWCHAASYCKTGVSWMTVDASSNSTPVSRSDLRYGVAMVTQRNQSRGISWGSCIYEYDKVPQRAPQLERVQTDSHLSLNVVWRLETCVDRVLVSHYIVQCCLYHTISCWSVRVGSETSQLQLRQLEWGQWYDVRLKQVTAAGKESNFSSPLSASPIFTGLLAGEVAGIAVGSVFLSVIVLLVVAMRLRGTVRRWGEREDIDVPLKAPAGESGDETDTPADTKTSPSSPPLREGCTAVHVKPDSEQVARLPQNYALIWMASESGDSVPIDDSRTSRNDRDWSENTLESERSTKPGCEYRAGDALPMCEQEEEDMGTGSEDEDSVPYIAVGVAHE